MSKKAPKKPELFDVKSYSSGRWRTVTEKPLPRTQAAMVVADQWRNNMLARLVQGRATPEHLPAVHV